MGILAGAAVIGALFSGASAYTQYKAGKKAKRVSKKAAAMEQKSTDEKVKRMKEDNMRRASLARARAAASGVGGASTEIYINALEKSGREEIDWLKEVGASAYQKRLDEGSSAYGQAMTGFWGSVGSTVSSGATAYEEYKLGQSE